MKLLTPRYNILDTTFIAAATVLVSQGRFIPAIAVFVLGAIVSGITNGVVATMEKDREWKRLADNDQVLEAIKMHRHLKKSTLKDATDEVRAYVIKRRVP